jgi:N6-L-threonylcarbamoyladenine synthase
LGESVDDAAGEAFDKSAKLLGLGYPGGPALAQRAAQGNSQRFNLPRPMLHSGDFDFSFSGLKTAVLTLVKQHPEPDEPTLNDLAASIQQAIVDVLVHKSVAAMRHTGLPTLVVAGGVGANQQLRTQLNMQAARRGFEVFYPPLTFCTDNGAMIAFAGAQRLAEAQMVGSFSIRPRWPLDELKPVTAQLTR